MSEELLLMDDDQGKELVLRAMFEVRDAYSRPVRAHEVAGIVTGYHCDEVPDRWVRRVQTLLDQLVRSGEVESQERDGFTFYGLNYDIE